MADIAFLLLIFFLVATTLNADLGILRVLAPVAETPAVPVPERNVFRVLVNDANELMVEDEPLPLSALRERTIGFLTNPLDADDLPAMLGITADECDRRIAALKRAEGPGRSGALERWQERKAAVALLGPYRELPGNAVISLQVGSGTSYDAYVQVQNELEGAVNDLRDGMSEKAFGRSFDELDVHDPEDQARIRAVRLAVPKRISEADMVQ